MIVRSMMASTFGALGFIDFLPGEIPGLDLAAKLMGFYVAKPALEVNLFP